MNVSTATRRSIFVRCRTWTALATGASLALLFATGLAAATNETSTNDTTALPADAIVELTADPAQIVLNHPFAYAQVIVTGRNAAGESFDLTRDCELSGDGEVVSVDERRLVRPVADGNGELQLSYGAQSVAIPVTVAGQNEPYEVSFVDDIQPVLAKLGCNTGTCHGSQSGKNGFKLSLRGYDADFDHSALTDELASRRFNRAAPERSLMLMKPAGIVPHEGGVLTRPGEPYYELIRSWIADGVRLDLDAPRVVAIEISPKKPIIARPEMQQQMKVVATYSDGSRRDVTAEAFMESSLGEVVKADNKGLLTAVRRGEAAVLARYEGAYDATPITVMGNRDGFAWVEQPTNNEIDSFVYDKLERFKILPSGLSSDAEFLRRVYLDLTGMPPTIAEIQAFLADDRDARAKRDEVIDQLVGGDAYVEHWTNKWADLLQVNRKFLGEEGAWAWRNWIRQALSD
ncbi:MAG: DUF1549 domain-containing protein, partial [Planctomycetales bacterium]|nr:DUF1549 domain-containing protein [Planctomycetales bacterium]